MQEKDCRRESLIRVMTEPLPFWYKTHEIQRQVAEYWAAEADAEARRICGCADCRG